MLKTSELLHRFNNPNLIQQDIDKEANTKLAGIGKYLHDIALPVSPLIGGAVGGALSSALGHQSIRKYFAR